MILEMVMESLFVVADVYFVSRISVDAVAVVGLTESVIMIIESIAIGVSMAATAIVARRVGEKNLSAASLSAVQSIIIGLTFAVLIGIPGYFFAEHILRWMGGTPEMIESGVSYTRIMLGFNVTIMMLFMLNAIFRGSGDAAMAMRSLWIANGLNIILDPCFIFGLGPFPEMGIQGAAVATNIGRGVGVLFQLYILLKGSSILKITWEHIKVNAAIIRRMLQVSIGGTGQFLIASASWIFLMRIMAEFGAETVAGYTISFRVIVFTLLPSWGMANAAATLVGQNLGANQPDRAEKSVWLAAKYNMIFLFAVSVFFFISAYPIVSIFTDNAQVVKIGVSALRIICLGYVFFAYGMVIGQAFNGAGDTKTPTYINFLCFWVLQIPLAYILGFYTSVGPTGVFWAIAIAETVLAIIAIRVFKRGKWKKMQV